MSQTALVRTLGGSNREVWAERTEVAGLMVTESLGCLPSEKSEFEAITHGATGIAIFQKVPKAVTSKILAVLGACGIDWTAPTSQEIQGQWDRLPTPLKVWFMSGSKEWWAA